MNNIRIDDNEIWDFIWHSVCRLKCSEMRCSALWLRYLQFREICILWRCVCPQNRRNRLFCVLSWKWVQHGPLIQWCLPAVECPFGTECYNIFLHVTFIFCLFQVINLYNKFPPLKSSCSLERAQWGFLCLKLHKPHVPEHFNLKIVETGWWWCLWNYFSASRQDHKTNATGSPAGWCQIDKSQNGDGCRKGGSSEGETAAAHGNRYVCEALLEVQMVPSNWFVWCLHVCVCACVCARVRACFFLFLFYYSGLWTVDKGTESVSEVGAPLLIEW